MHYVDELAALTSGAIKELYSLEISPSGLVFQSTKKEFEGDVTLVVFGIAKQVKQSPEAVGHVIGKYLKTNSALVHDFNCVKGFLNIILHSSHWLKLFSSALNSSSFGIKTSVKTDHPVLVEYSSPNTNKPLHLGHIRNNLLGFAVAELLKAQGEKVMKVNLVNDRGIHICKSMLAWQKFGNGETPESTGMKGDHLVGKYYVEFDRHMKKQVESLVHHGENEDEADRHAPIMKAAQQMLQQWEAHDPEVLDLWKKMNGWVYEGFKETYKTLGVDFDRMYYESETYLLGKKIVEEGVSKGIFYKKNDRSVWVDLTDEGLDQKLLLRSDGTSVYITQDLGTAVQRHEEFQFAGMIYVVGNEQDYHFKVLKAVLKKLGYEWADKLYHLSYNMVDLPGGKMKSREGTVVDADELMDEMFTKAEKITRQLGKIEGMSEEEAKKLFKTIGLGALKYFILKVDPEKRMLFNPEESIDFNGNTGPFIQYTYARIQSVMRKAATNKQFGNYTDSKILLSAQPETKERELIKWMMQFPDVLTEAANRHSPALVCNYIYELARLYNQFYHDHAIVDDKNEALSKFRLAISEMTGRIIKSGMKLAGIDVPERM